MSDPAVNAVQRARQRDNSKLWALRDEPLTPIAYEALAPIRKDHYPVAYTNRRRCCVRCYDENGRPQIWPCNPATHAYTTEELKQ